MVERLRSRSPLAPIFGLALLPLAGIACSSGTAGGGPALGASGGSGQDSSVPTGAAAGGQTTPSSSGSGSSGGAASATSSSGSADIGTASGGGSGTASGSGGTASGSGSGTASGSGGTASGSGSGELGGSSGVIGNAAGGGGAHADAGGAAPDASSGSAPTPQTFVCSEVMGLMLTDQWYTAGFEKAAGIDDARWQLKWMDHAYIDEWANPNSTFWGIVPTSPCAQDSSNPDRVVLVALSWTLVTLADWETNVQKDVDNIKAKYSNIKQIVLMTIIRGPNNVSCGNTTVVAENTLIPSYVDQALADVAAANPNLVKVAPKFAAASCADFMGTGPHLTPAGDTAIAQMVAATYANQ